MRSRNNRSGSVVDFVKYCYSSVKFQSLFPWVNEENFVLHDEKARLGLPVQSMTKKAACQGHRLEEEYYHCVLLEKCIQTGYWFIGSKCVP